MASLLAELKGQLKEQVGKYPKVDDPKQKEIITQETADIIRQINEERERISQTITLKKIG